MGVPFHSVCAAGELMLLCIVHDICIWLGQGSVFSVRFSFDDVFCMSTPVIAFFPWVRKISMMPMLLLIRCEIPQLAIYADLYCESMNASSHMVCFSFFST